MMLNVRRAKCQQHCIQQIISCSQQASTNIRHHAHNLQSKQKDKSSLTDFLMDWMTFTTTSTTTTTTTGTARWKHQHSLLSLLHWHPKRKIQIVWRSLLPPLRLERQCKTQSRSRQQDIRTLLFKLLFLFRRYSLIVFQWPNRNICFVICICCWLSPDKIPSNTTVS